MMRAMIIGAISFTMLMLSGCIGSSPNTLSGSDTGFTPQASSTHCVVGGTLSERVRFVDAQEAARLLRSPDDWVSQLSPFERSARRRTLSPTSTEELLDYVAAQVLEWTPDERAYWSVLVDGLSVALTGLNLSLPDVALIKSTGFDEFGAAYARRDVIVLPRARIAIAGDQRRDFFLLAHELFHLLSWNDSVLRDQLYALLGFERFTGFELPPELDERRLSNPSGHTYDHALVVQTADGPATVVPFVRSAVPLDELTALPAEGPAFFAALETLLVAVDTRTGKAVRGPSGELITYEFAETDWPQRTQRNTSYTIHPDEVVADNFGLVMEQRSTGVRPAETPSGFPINDEELLTRMEEVFRQGCE